jgi:glycosyltransferase involved in cell wall biosynthesis
LRQEKRPDWAIEAAIKNGLKIDLYGDGPELDSLRNEFSNSLKLVDFKGYRKDPWKEIASEALIIVPSEFEGDGMVVVEAILSQNPVLLFDNEDLRRFSMPDVNYFKSRKELFHKVSVGKITKFRDYMPSQDLKTELLEKRNISYVADQWEKMFIS